MAKKSSHTTEGRVKLADQQNTVGPNEKRIITARTVDDLIPLLLGMDKAIQALVYNQHTYLPVLRLEVVSELEQ